MLDLAPCPGFPVRFAPFVYRCWKLVLRCGQHAAAVAGDLQFFLGGDHFNLVGGEPEIFQTCGGGGSYAIAMFADAAGEDEKIYTSQQGRVSADRFPNCDVEDIER